MPASDILNFWPSRTLPNGLVANRGDAILVGFNSEIRTAHIERFTDDHSSHVSAAVITGQDKGGSAAGKGGGATQYPSHTYIGPGAGFRHWADTEGSGNRYALVSEGEEGARKVWEYMNRDADRPKPVEEVVEEEAAPIPGNPSGEQDPRSFSKKDLNRDGTATPEEIAEFNRNKGKR